MMPGLTEGGDTGRLHYTFGGMTRGPFLGTNTPCNLPPNHGRKGVGDRIGVKGQLDNQQGEGQTDRRRKCLLDCWLRGLAIRGD